MKPTPATPRRRTAPKSDRATWITTLDAVHDRCSAVETLAALMEATTDRPVDADVVRNAGALITNEMTGIRRLLDAWHSNGNHP